jgi:hypothetical protein
VDGGGEEEEGGDEGCEAPLHHVEAIPSDESAIRKEL